MNMHELQIWHMAGYLLSIHNITMHIFYFIIDPPPMEAYPPFK